MNNYIYLICGASGVGKTTLINELSARYGLSQIESYTTRKPRYEGEQGHTFVSDQEFDNLENLVAYTEFDGHRYCATAEQVENSDLYTLDPYGVDEFEYRYHGNKTPIVICLYATEDERRKRMLGRGDTEESADRRIIHDREAFSDEKINFSKISTYRLDCNCDIESMVNRAAEIINNVKEGSLGI